MPCKPDIRIRNYTIRNVDKVDGSPSSTLHPSPDSVHRSRSKTITEQYFWRAWVANTERESPQVRDASSFMTKELWAASKSKTKKVLSTINNQTTTPKINNVRYYSAPRVPVALGTMAHPRRLDKQGRTRYSAGTNSPLLRCTSVKSLRPTNATLSRWPVQPSCSFRKPSQRTASDMSSSTLQGAGTTETQDPLLHHFSHGKSKIQRVPSTLH